MRKESECDLSRCHGLCFSFLFLSGKVFLGGHVGRGVESCIKSPKDNLWEMALFRPGQGRASSWHTPHDAAPGEPPGSPGHSGTQTGTAEQRPAPARPCEWQPHRESGSLRAKRPDGLPTAKLCLPLSSQTLRSSPELTSHVALGLPQQSKYHGLAALTQQKFVLSPFCRLEV